MTSGRGNRTLALALGMSLALHVALLLAAPNPAGFGTPLERRSVVAVRLTSPTVAPSATQPEQPKEIELGLDAPNPRSPTWLGFTEYLKQLAAKGEIEQAAFTDHPVAAAPAAAPAPVEQPTVSEPSDSTSTVNEPAPAVAADASHASGEIDQPKTPEPEKLPAKDSTPDESPESTDVSEQRATAEGLALAHSETRSDSTAASKPTGSFLAPLSALIEQAREAARQASAARQTPPGAVTPPDREMAIARTPTHGAASTGAQSDRESDPTSIIDAPRDQWQLGKPLAAHGLEIKPRRPEMTILTSLTAWPRNPLCTISFDREGVPTRAVIVRSSGDNRVDSAIEASLYRWRAAGKQLESLEAGETVDLTIRLLINPERRSEDSDEPAAP